MRRANWSSPGERRRSSCHAAAVLLDGWAAPTRRASLARLTTPTSTSGTGRPSAGRSTPPSRRTACRPPPTSTASTGSTPRTSTCRSAPTRPCPGIGAVQDEDVVFYNDGTWSVYFDGTAPSGSRRPTWTSTRSASSGGTLYFSTTGNTNPPGVGGSGGRRRHLQLERHRRIARVVGRDGERLRGRRRTSTGWSGSTALTSTCRSAARPRRCLGSETCRTRTSSSHNGTTGRSTSTAPVHGLTSDNLDVDAFDVP